MTSFSDRSSGLHFVRHRTGTVTKTLGCPAPVFAGQPAKQPNLSPSTPLTSRTIGHWQTMLTHVSFVLPIMIGRLAEREHNLPPGAINAGRVARYVRSGPTRDPMKRGKFKSPKHEPLILAAAANDILVHQLDPGRRLQDTLAVTDKLHAVYSQAGLPCRNRQHLLHKLRRHHPKVFHYNTYSVEDRRAHWCTAENLARWHAG